MSLLSKKTTQFSEKKPQIITLEEYLNLCKTEPNIYRSVQGQLLDQFGTPKRIDTANNPVLSRVHGNRVLTRYPAFEKFYGMEDTIEDIAGFLKHADQGLEERKQVLYLLGPVGSAKSSLAEKLKSLQSNVRIARLVYIPEGSEEIEVLPSNCHPFMVFDESDFDELQENYGISHSALVRRSQNHPMFTKRLNEANGDLSRFKVELINASEKEQIAISKTEPGDENNQDISTLVGKVDIRQLEDFSQSDPEAYNYNSGSLSKSNQGIMEFVEMFKAPIKVLHPLLTATQEGNYNPTEGFAAIPFDGLILAHSNESEWLTFRNNKNNEAFLDRVYIVKVPYSLRVSEEIKIYKKLLQESELSKAACAPHTLEIMAQMAVLSRLEDPENSNIYSKMHVYDGENLKDTDPKAKSIQEYRDYASLDEGMSGLSTRFAFKILSKVFNFDDSEIAANPVHLFNVLEKQIKKTQLPEEETATLMEHLKGYLMPKYVEFIGKEIQTCYLESYSEYGQNIFDTYITYADFWIQDQEYRDHDTGQMFDREALSAELEKIEKPAGISNPKDFRNEVVNFVLRARANNNGNNPAWTSYEKLRAVIEKKMFSNTEDLIPLISFGGKGSEEDQNKHVNFVKRMVEKGYTEKQVRLLCEWYLRVRKAN
jgi:serine protein kinase